MKVTRVMVADDHVLVRRGVTSLLNSEPDIEICGEADNGRLAVDGAARWKPDMIVMDVVMPELNGLEATRQILRILPNTQILILTGHESDELVRNVFAAGARGYVLKSDVADHFLLAIRTLKQHQLFFSSRVAELVMRGYLEGPVRSEMDSEPTCQLSPREREILQLVAEGNANKEVAGILSISPKTVETHRAHIMTKLNLNSLADLVRYAIRNNIASS